MTFAEKDMKILWGKAAGRCSMPDCRKVLVHKASEGVASRNILVGHNCHIVGEKRSSPRGKSILSSAERKRYPNLILLCSVHHTQIDQDPLAWPIEKLHQIKSDHEMWVETQLTVNTDDPALKLYSELVNDITESFLLSYWDWLSDHAVRLLLSEEFVNGVRFAGERVFRMIWPKKYPEMEKAIINLAERSSQYVDCFISSARLRHNSKEPGKGFFVEDKLWTRQWTEDYNRLSTKSKRWQKQVTSLFFNMVVALNEYADSVRNHLNPRYFLFEGKFAINDYSGVISDGESTTYLPSKYRDVKMKHSIRHA